MASLTQTAIVARRSIRFSIYGVMLLIVARILFGFGAGIYRHFFPEKEPPPTVAFDRLPAIEFPINKLDPSKLTYTLQTPSGGLPALPTQARVYLMPRGLPDVFSVESGITKARQLGFTGPSQQINETLYRFSHQTYPKTLEMNVVSNAFSISYDLAAYPAAISAVPPAPDVATKLVQSYLSNADLLPLDLSGPTSFEFLKVQESKLVKAASLSEGQLTKVNLFRAAYNELPSLGPNAQQANVWFMVSGSSQEPLKVLTGEYHYFPIDQNKVATYPIKTAQEAWNQMTSGAAYIAQAPENNTNIVIRRVYLANYDPDTPQPFFQPIIVFAGDDFLAYVPAVTSDYYGN